MATNDVYFVRLFGQAQGQVAENVFYYRVTAGSGSAEDLAIELGTDLIPAIAAIQTPRYSSVRLQVVNTNLNTDQEEGALGEFGTFVTTADMPMAVAAALRAVRPGMGAQYGYKRFSGVPAQVTTTGEWTTAYRNLIRALAVALAASPEGTEGTYVPVVCSGGFRLGVPATVLYPATTRWSYNAFPSHQDTRQSYNWLNEAPT